MGRSILGISADWKALLFCMLAACTFWFMKALNNDYTDDITYPLKVQYDDKKVIPLKKLPKSIRLNVTGYGWSLLKNSLGIGIRPIEYQPTDLPNNISATSEELLPIVRKQVGDVTLNYIVTDSIAFLFDQMGEKRVKVVVDSAFISLAPNYKITSPVVTIPDSVDFSGPHSLLKKFPDSIVISVHQKNIKESFNSKIKIPEQNAGYRMSSMYKDVRVRFAVSKFEKESIHIPVKAINFPSEEYAFEKVVILTYYVKQENKNKAKSESFSVVLDYKKYDKNDSTIKPTVIKKPAFVRDYYFTPYAVKVSKLK